MNPAQLLAHFDRISEAPDAIPRLRRFILDLAVRGKLVEQDPSDDPAVFAYFDEDGKKPPYALPRTWRWVRIGDQLTLLNGMAFKPTDWLISGIRIVRIQNLNNPDAPFNYCDPSFARESALINDGSFLISWSGTPGTSFGAFIWNRGPAVLNQHIFRCDFKTHAFSPEYLRLAINGRLDEMIEKAHGGVGLQHITKGKLETMLIGLPPLPEQHRIVAKVDELMALCDQLEAAKAERESQRDRLIAASLHRLNSSADADASRKNARFYLNHLPRLTTRPEHIKQLRQTILNLAVRGRLVPQDPNDEPAAELLRRIEAEKIRLIKEGKIGPLKPLTSTKSDNLSFPLMPGWKAVKISQILVEIQTGPFGSSLHQSDYQKGGIPVINPASIKNERLIPVDGMTVGQAMLDRLATFKLQEHDIVLGRRGEMGRCAVVTDKEVGWLCGTGSLVLRLPTCISPRFIVLLIGSPFVRQYLGGSAVGATMQNLNQSILLNLVIGLPPLAEQHRIVAKVDELMALCDQLEAELTTTQADSRRLLELCCIRLWESIIHLGNGG